MSSFLWTGTGGYYNRIGTIIALIRNVHGIQGTTAPSPASAWGSGGQSINTEFKLVEDLLAEFASNEQSAVQNVPNLFDSWRGTSNSWFNSLRTIAQNFTIDQVDRERKLHQRNIQNALDVLYLLMLEDSQTLAQNTTSFSAPTPGPNNTGEFNWAAHFNTNLGNKLDYVIPEFMTAVCTNAQTIGSGGAESFTVRGRANQASELEWDYPTGSGASTTIRTSNPSRNQDSSSNFLNNSDFETWSQATNPDNWVPTDPGTIIARDQTVFARGASSVKVTGDGTNAARLTQQFNNAAGTNRSLELTRVYGVGAYVRAATGVPTAGTLDFTLTDGTNPIKDAAGADQKFQVDLTSLVADTWTPVSGFLTTGRNIPASAYLDIAFNSVASGQVLNLDSVVMNTATRLYTAGGPWLFGFPAQGETKNPQVGDFWTLTFNNNYAGQVLTWMGRLFPYLISQAGYSLPSASSPTIADTVIP